MCAQVIKPVFAAIADEVSTVSFVKIDVDEAGDLAMDHQISGIPAFHFYRGEEKVDEMVGASEDDLRAKVGAL